MDQVFERGMTMYRQYEDVHYLADRVEDLKALLAREEAKKADEWTLMSIWEELHETEQRLNFAIQDMEYDEYYC